MTQWLCLEEVGNHNSGAGERFRRRDDVQNDDMIGMFAVSDVILCELSRFTAVFTITCMSPAMRRIVLYGGRSTRFEDCFD
jgi:hypothetical protein